MSDLLNDTLHLHKQSIDSVELSEVLSYRLKVLIDKVLEISHALLVNLLQLSALGLEPLLSLAQKIGLFAPASLDDQSGGLSERLAQPQSVIEHE